MIDLFRKFSLAFDEAVHLVIVHGLHELEGDIVVFLQDVHDLLNTFLHHFQHRLLQVHLRFLLQVAHGVARGPHHLSFVGFLYAGDDLEQRRFTGPVKADDANLGPVEEAQVDIFEDDFVIVGKDFSHPVHGEDNLFVGHSLSVYLAKIVIFSKFFV